MTGPRTGPMLLLEASTTVGVVALVVDGAGTPRTVTVAAD